MKAVLAILLATAVARAAAGSSDTPVDNGNGAGTATVAGCMVPKSATDIGNGYFQTADDHMFDSGTCKTIATKDEKNGFFKNDDTFDPQAVSFFCANSGDAPMRPVRDCPCETEEQALVLAYEMIEARVSANPRIEYSSGVVKRTDADGKTRWHPVQVNAGKENEVKLNVGPETVATMHYHPNRSEARMSLMDFMGANATKTRGHVLVLGDDGRLSRRMLGYSPSGLVATFVVENGTVRAETKWVAPTELYSCSKDEKDDSIAFADWLATCGVAEGAKACQEALLEYKHAAYCNPDPGGLLEGTVRTDVVAKPIAGSNDVPAAKSDKPSGPSGPKPGRTGAGNGSDDDSWWRKELDSWSEP